MKYPTSGEVRQKCCSFETVDLSGDVAKIRVSKGKFVLLNVEIRRSGQADIHSLGLRPGLVAKSSVARSI